MKKLQIIFMGTPEISCPVLESLIKSENIEIKLVITQPDKPVGRKQVLTPSPIKKLALQHNLPISQPQTFKNNAELYAQIKGLNPDFFVVIAYGKILPSEFLQIPKIAPINIHVSLLPKYRGASPIQETLLHGDKEAGISIMKMSEKMDEGPIYLQTKVNIQDDENCITLENTLSNLSGKIITDCLEKISTNELKPVEQDHTKATFCQKISKENSKINFSTYAAAQIINMHKAYIKWPGVSFHQNEKTFKIIELKLSSHDLKPNEFKFVNDEILVGTKAGSLKLTKLQPEGKNAMDAKSIINGYQKYFQ